MTLSTTGCSHLGTEFHRRLIMLTMMMMMMGNYIRVSCTLELVSSSDELMTFTVMAGGLA